MRGHLERFVEELKRRKVVSTAGMYLVAAFVAMQVVDAVFPYLFRDPDTAGRFVLVVLAIGFPIVLGLSWALELTLRRETPPTVAPEGAPPDRPRPRPKQLRPDSVAVLPFENLSPDPDNAYFSDGITDDIITSVAQIRGLRVLSRTSVMQYKGVNRHVGDIAGELGVATLVSGSVRRSGSRVRVVAELVDARTDDHLWTETFDREIQDIFEVQSELAAKIAEAVQRELSPSDRHRIESRGTHDAEAYDLYLRARFLWNQRSEASTGESVRYFQRAIERDPGFALAHAGLADAYTVLGIYGARAPRDVLEAAKASADAALAIEPTLGEAIAAKACVTGIFDWRWRDAEEAFRRATELAPSYPTAHQWYAMNLLVPQGRFDEARTQLERASELDPASGAIAVSQGIITFFARELDAATAELETVARLHPRYALVHLFLGQCYELKQDYERSMRALERSVELADDGSEALAVLAHVKARAGRADQAEAILARLEERATRRYVSPVLIAQILLGIDRVDAALDRLDQAVRERSTDLIWLKVRPVYDPLRSQPRFATILDELGLAD